MSTNLETNAKKLRKAAKKLAKRARKLEAQAKAGQDQAPRDAAQASGAMVREAVRHRRSFSKVTEAAPTHEELVNLIEVLASVPDHSSMRPWRIIELRGDSRDILGRALAQAEADEHGTDDEKHEKKVERYIGKARRAPLVLAVVACTKPSKKVPDWEQEAVASGVAHTLSLLLHEAGWGTIWRTGTLARSEVVRKAHQLRDGERLLGWIYVGGIPEEHESKPKPRKPLDLDRHLSSL